MAKTINATQSKTWARDRERMLVCLENSDSPSVAVLHRFKKYSAGTKAALVANYTRGAYSY